MFALFYIDCITVSRITKIQRLHPHFWSRGTLWDYTTVRRLQWQDKSCMKYGRHNRMWITNNVTFQFIYKMAQSVIGYSHYTDKSGVRQHNESRCNTARCLGTKCSKASVANGISLLSYIQGWSISCCLCTTGILAKFTPTLKSIYTSPVVLLDSIQVWV